MSEKNTNWVLKYSNMGTKTRPQKGYRIRNMVLMSNFKVPKTNIQASHHNNNDDQDTSLLILFIIIGLVVLMFTWFFVFFMAHSITDLQTQVRSFKFVVQERQLLNKTKLSDFLTNVSTPLVFFSIRLYEIHYKTFQTLKSK